MVALAGFVAFVTAVVFLVRPAFADGGTGAAASGNQGSVRVTVVEDRAYGRPAYRYRVENNNRTRAIVTFRVGDDIRGGQPELQQPPYGWTVEKGLPIGSAAAPDGWTVEAIREEEDNRWYVEWFSSEMDEIHDLAPGQMTDAFGVIVFDEAPEYLNGHWSVVFDNGEQLSGRIERDRP